jgi:hypothetical protein
MRSIRKGNRKTPFVRVFRLFRGHSVLLLCSPVPRNLRIQRSTYPRGMTARTARREQERGDAYAAPLMGDLKGRERIMGFTR